MDSTSFFAFVKKFTYPCYHCRYRCTCLDCFKDALLGWGCIDVFLDASVPTDSPQYGL